jgi:hypothetical protein
MLLSSATDIAVYRGPAKIEQTIIKMKKLFEAARRYIELKN